MSDKKLYLLDGMALVYRGHFALLRNPPMTTQGMNTAAPFTVANLLLSLLDKVQPSHLAVAFDTPEPTFRHKEYSEYKAQRESMPEELSTALPYVFRLFEGFNVPILRMPGWEADDVIGTLTNEASTKGIRSLVYTCDLDLLQVVDENTQVKVFSQYWPTRNFDQDAVFNRFHGLAPKNIPDFKALVGDKSDNLPGVTGIGEKSASVILNHFSNLENIYSDLDQILELPVRGAKRVRNILEQNQELAFFMRTMTTVVCNVPTGINIDQSVLRLSTA